MYYIAQSTDMKCPSRRVTDQRSPLHKKDEVLHLVLDFLYYFLASRAEIDSIIFDIFSSAFASFAFSASISCSGAFAGSPDC